MDLSSHQDNFKKILFGMCRKWMTKEEETTIFRAKSGVLNDKSLFVHVSAKSIAIALSDIYTVHEGSQNTQICCGGH